MALEINKTVTDICTMVCRITSCILVSRTLERDVMSLEGYGETLEDDVWQGCSHDTYVCRLPFSNLKLMLMWLDHDILAIQKCPPKNRCYINEVGEVAMRITSF